MNIKENWKVALLLTFAVLAINLSLIFDVGFLSDDWDLLKRTQDVSIFAQMEQHHYSPFVAGVFKFVGYWGLSPVWIHLAAFLIHGINIYLVLGLCGRLGLTHWEKWVAGILFALSPAGFESLAWCCAIGYILCSTWMILALKIYLRKIAGDDHFLERGEVRSNYASYQIAVLQLLALATWDWGILLTPLLCVVGWVYFREKVPKGLFPTVVMWVGLLAIKKFSGFSVGYEINPLSKAFFNLGTSFMLTIWPEFSRSFYTSMWGVGLAAVTMLLFVWVAVRDKISRLGLALFFVSMVPVALAGYPQSRYVYFSAIFLYWVFARALDRSSWGRVAAVVYVVSAIFWTIERRDVWLETDLQARFYKNAVEAGKEAYGKVALPNVPDQVKGFDLVWLPVVWRCGTECFGSDVVIMNPFGKTEILESEISEDYRVLRIGDRRKSRSISR